MAVQPSPEADILRAWVQKAQEGDTGAFEQVYNHFFLPVYRYTAFRVSSDLAEDLVADIFVKAWEKLHTYEERKGIPFAAWLFRIARHTIIDAYRQQRGFEEVSEDIPDPDDLNRADTAVYRNDLLRIVRQALAALPRRYREVLLLSYVAELSHPEVARTLRLTEGAVRILKFRALKKLQVLLPADIGYSSLPAPSPLPSSLQPNFFEIP